MSNYRPKRLHVLAEPHPFLRRTAKPVEDPNQEHIQQLIEDMIVTMRAEDGIGLAAIQVEKDLRLIVIETKDGAIPFINPEIVDHSDKTEMGEEGCLSVPGTYGEVRRYTDVTLQSLDRHGNEQTHDAKGLFARVIQHEIDHLNGILYIDRVENFDRSLIPDAVQAL